MSPEFADTVAKLCYEKFKALPKTGKPQVKKEWTLLAAVVISYGNLTDGLQIVSLSTGTKCLGFSQLSDKGDAVFDSHAEVLARRAFIRYLYQEILQKKNSSVLYLDEAELKFKVKNGIKFHLFISHVPCGDAAIFPKCNILKRSLSPELEKENNESNTAKKLKRTSCEKTAQKEPDLSQNMSVVTDIYRTGAKCVESGEQDPKEPGTMFHAVGALRTKPGRGDPTWSMSCSDKIALWNVCGLQGALLSHYLSDPIYLDSLIFGKCPFNELAVERAVVQRLSNLSNLPPLYRINHPNIFQSSLTFDFSKEKLLKECPDTTPCAAAIIWCDIPNFLNISVNGRKQGITKKNLHKPASRLEICKSVLFEKFLEVKSSLLISDIKSPNEDNMTYMDYKSLAKAYQEAKQCVYEVFKGWKRKPRDLQKFTCSVNKEK